VSSAAAAAGLCQRTFGQDGPLLGEIRQRSPEHAGTIGASSCTVCGLRVVGKPLLGVPAKTQLPPDAGDVLSVRV